MNTNGRIADHTIEINGTAHPVSESVALLLKNVSEERDILLEVLIAAEKSLQCYGLADPTDMELYNAIARARGQE